MRYIHIAFVHRLSSGMSRSIHDRPGRDYDPPALHLNCIVTLPAAKTPPRSCSQGLEMLEPKCTRFPPLGVNPPYAPAPLPTSIMIPDRL
jgi:hypothetical protein